jgi:hypothetical protein
MAWAVVALPLNRFFLNFGAASNKKLRTTPCRGTGSIRAKIYSKRICLSLSPMFSVRLDVKRQSSKGGITAFVTV